MEKIDAVGQVIGFSILAVSQQKLLSPLVASILNLIHLSETAAPIPLARLFAEFEPKTVTQIQYDKVAV